MDTIPECLESNRPYIILNRPYSLDVIVLIVNTYCPDLHFQDKNEFLTMEAFNLDYGSL
jgi:hypothetical protein